MIHEWLNDDLMMIQSDSIGFNDDSMMCFLNDLVMINDDSIGFNDDSMMFRDILCGHNWRWPQARQPVAAPGEPRVL